MVTVWMCRGHGQIRADDGTNPNLDGVTYHNVLSFTKTVAVSPAFGYGAQLRPKYAVDTSAIPDPDIVHGEITIRKGASLLVNAVLGYENAPVTGIITGIRDPYNFARARFVTNPAGTPIEILGLAEMLPDNNLTTYVSMKQTSVANLGLPALTSVPIVSEFQNQDGNYLVSMSRRMIFRLTADVVIPANQGFSIQMRTTAILRGFEYDAQAILEEA